MSRDRFFTSSSSSSFSLLFPLFIFAESPSSRQTIRLFQERRMISLRECSPDALRKKGVWSLYLKTNRTSFSFFFSFFHPIAEIEEDPRNCVVLNLLFDRFPIRIRRACVFFFFLKFLLSFQKRREENFTRSFQSARHDLYSWNITRDIRPRRKIDRGKWTNKAACPFQLRFPPTYVSYSAK